MSFISRKIPLLFGLGVVWMLASGFDNLGVDMSAGIESVMDVLTSEDFEEIQIQDEWESKVLANVEDYVTVRSEPNSESEAIGRMFKGDGGDIVEQTEGWTKISSGNVEGYVSNEYLLFGSDAYNQAQEEVTLVATSLTGGLRVREEGNTDARILKNVEEGAKLDVVGGAEEGSEWIQVEYAEEKTGFVSAEYVDVQYELGEAMTMEEIEEKEAEEKREALKQQLEAFKDVKETRPSASSPVNNRTHTVVYGDTLWGLAIQYYGNGLEWQKLYNANRDVMDQEAQKRGYPNCNNGNYIWVGTVLVIP